MARSIPIDPDSNHQSVRVQLDGTTFELEIRWNTQAAGYFMSILAADGTLLLANRRLVVGWRLTQRFRDPRLPLGDFLANDTSGKQIEAAFGELGTRVLLLYLEAADLQ